MTLQSNDFRTVATTFFDAAVKEGKPEYRQDLHKALTAAPIFCLGAINAILGTVERDTWGINQSTRFNAGNTYFSDEFVAASRETCKALRDMDLPSQGIPMDDGSLYNNFLFRLSPEGSAEQHDAMQWKINHANAHVTPENAALNQDYLKEIEQSLLTKAFSDLAGQLTVHSDGYVAPKAATQNAPRN